MNNQFLSDFMRMRQALNTVGQSKPSAGGGEGKPKKGKKTVEPVKEGITLQSILEEEPSHKVVRDYFRERIEQLVEEA
jgi:hypothetical protein